MVAAMGCSRTERCAPGRREFSDVCLYFAELMDKELPGIKFRNCTMEFVRFRGFSLADLTDAVFRNCTIEYSYFESATLKNTKMLSCRISWCIIINAALGELDYSTSTQYKVITDLSQLTQRDIDEALANLGPYIQSLDMEIRNRLQGLIAATLGPKGFEVASTGAAPGQYAAHRVTYSAAKGLYNFDRLMDEMVQKYGQKMEYGMRGAYKRDAPYEQAGKK